VGFVAYDKIPFCLIQLGLNIFVPAQLIEPTDCEGCFQEPVAGAGSLEFVICHNVERQIETAKKLILPLLGEISRTDDKTPFQISPDEKFFNVQTGHNCLACPWIISEKET
jgi:hypothetical protein